MKKLTEEQLRKAIKHDPKNPELQMELGNLLLEGRNINNNNGHLAIECFKNAIHLEPLNPEYHFILGKCYDSTGIWKHGARGKFKTCIYLNYKVEESQKYLREVNDFIAKDDADRLNTYLGWLRDKPNNPGSYSCMSIYHRHFDIDYTKALEYALKSLELEPDGTEGLMNAGRSYSHLGRVEEAVECFRKCLKKKDSEYDEDMDEEEKDEKVQKIFYGSNDEDDAEDFELYDGADDEDHDYDGNEQFYREIASVYQDNKQLEKAIEWLLKCIRKYPGTTFAYLSLGECYDKLGEIELAIVPFKKSISLDPEGTNWEAYDFLIQYYGSNKKLNVAEKYIRDAIRCNPDSHDFYFFKGVHSELTKDYNEAINQYLISLVFKPDFAPAYNNLSSVCIKYNQLNEGIDYLLNGLKVNPDMIAIHANLKKLYALKGDQAKVDFHEERIQEIKISKLFKD